MADTETRVLVAEDETLIRVDMVETLRERGLDVLEAADGNEALALMNDPDTVELLVTDINMPGQDGISVAQQAREQHPTIPIVFVSARPDQLEAAGTPIPHRVLVKPFSMTALVAVVKELLDRE